MVRRGDIAICGSGSLGLVLSDKLQKITYPNGTQGDAYVGIHLTDKLSTIGSDWSSRNPIKVGHIENVEIFLRHFDYATNEA